MDIQTRQLTADEKVSVEYLYQNSSVPAWGAVVHMPFGDVLIFDGADGVRRYTVISGPDAAELIARINQTPYTSPDAGLISLAEDITNRAISFGTSMVKTLAIGAAVLLLVMYSPQIKRVLS